MSIKKNIFCPICEFHTMENTHEFCISSNGNLPKFSLYNNPDYIFQTENISEKELEILKEKAYKEDKIICYSCGRKISFSHNDIIKNKYKNIKKYSNLMKNRLPKIFQNNKNNYVITYLLHYVKNIPISIIYIILNYCNYIDYYDKYKQLMLQFKIEYINLFENKINNKYLYFLTKHVLNPNHNKMQIYRWYDKYYPPNRDMLCYYYMINKFFDRGEYYNGNINNKFCDYMISYLYMLYYSSDIINKIYNNIDNKKIEFYQIFNNKIFICFYFSLIYDYNEIIELGKLNSQFINCYNDTFVEEIKNNYHLYGIVLYLDLYLNN